MFGISLQRAKITIRAFTILIISFHTKGILCLQTRPEISFADETVCIIRVCVIYYISCHTNELGIHINQALSN